jgi:hypothetical protein
MPKTLPIWQCMKISACRELDIGALATILPDLDTSHALQ